MRSVFDDLEGKTYIITGGAGASAGGTGSALTEKLCALGANVAVWDIADEVGEALCSKLTADGFSTLYVHCDVRKVSDVQNAVQATIEKFGRVDGLVNNAFWHADVQPPLHEMTLEDWDAHIDINLRCHFIVCKYVIPELLKNEKSVILNIGSTGAHRGEDGYFAYGAAKAGLEVLTRNIAAQYGRQGLKCNCLVPGLIVSEQFEATIAQNEILKAIFGKMDKNCLLQQGHTSGKAVADSALYLLSDLSRDMTAQCIILDGGNISHCPQWAEMRNY